MKNPSNNNFQLICFDIDNTLAPLNQELSTRTIEVVKALQNIGKKIILATGKNLPASRNVVDALNLQDPLIFVNGALIQYRSGEILTKEIFPKDILMNCLESGRKHNIDMVLHFPDKMIALSSGRFHKKFRYDRGSYFHLIDNWEDLGVELEQALKIVCVDRDQPENLQVFAKVFRKEVPHKLNTCFSLSVLFEIMPYHVNKGHALKKVADFLDIPMSSSIAFGDGENDIEMLSTAGLGIAVENAAPSLKKAADKVILSCEEDGPAIFLQEFFALQL